jgi:hypothetical protein
MFSDRRFKALLYIQFTMLDFVQWGRGNEQNLGLVCLNARMMNDLVEILLVLVNGAMLLGR